MTKTYVLSGKVMAKKNNKQIFRTRDGRPFITSSKQFKTWDDETVYDIKKQGITRFPGAVKMNVEFVVGDKRKFDLSNSFESIADLLVNCGVLVDDNYSILQEVNMKYAGYKKGIWETTVILQEIEGIV